MIPFSGCLRVRAKSDGDIAFRMRTQRSCSPSTNDSDVSIGVVRASSSFAHAASLYGLIVGVSSVRASLNRMNAFAWLSGTWCTTCRTVQPSGRYGVSSCASSNPLMARRRLAGAAVITAIASRR